jgi:hypothetical protein
MEMIFWSVDCRGVNVWCHCTKLLPEEEKKLDISAEFKKLKTNWITILKLKYCERKNIK